MTKRSGRAGMKYYGMLSFSTVGHEPDHPTASSKTPKHNCGSYPRSQGGSDLPTTVTTTKRFPGSLRVCKRLSPTIRSVRRSGVLSGIDKDSRRSYRWQSTTKIVD